MEKSQSITLAKGIAGAAMGGTLGFAAFILAAQQGLYALAVPGALLGLGCGLASRTRSQILGLVCAFAAIPLTLIAEWKFAPFIADDSFIYLVTHLHQLRGITWVMLIFGVGSAYWLGVGRTR